jgi:F420-0:gamma-glutamyl ligase
MAAAAELVMGKKSQMPVVLIRGYEGKGEEGSARELLRPEAEDLFRQF